MEKAKRIQARRDNRVWLSPPDPSTNQDIASGLQHEGTATLFFKGSIFTEWRSKSTTSLLWIHGKPGSGKTILCSAIIQDIMALRDAGLASLAYFYFDFRDPDKRNYYDLLLSILTQLLSCSDDYCDIVSCSYGVHDDGAHKPSASTLMACLKEMLSLPGQAPIYIILDALDECSNSCGIPSSREQVLDLIRDLVGLQLSNIHICVTSQPELDISAALEPLASQPVSIHDQSGQKQDIEDYVKFVVYADSDTAVKRWRGEDKELVIQMLTERAAGMSQWIYCQLEALRHSLPPSLRRNLNELPQSLDETYERVLKEIGTANRNLAHRLLQCLVVAVRPLRIEELAEVLALDFDDTNGSTPELKEDWRLEDRQCAVLSTCSSLVTLIDVEDSRVIQLSRFSVKEFLTSDRLASLKGDVSHFAINPEAAHATLAQACLAVLLQLDGSAENDEVEGRFPLARYAARHWVEHAQFGMVSTRVEDGMRRLFDSTKPHLAAWIKLHNIDRGRFFFNDGDDKVPGSPLYYASLCGFRDLATHIIANHPEQVNARGGRNHSPLVAALDKRHFEVAALLYQHGGAVDVIGDYHLTPLYCASAFGLVDVARWLLDHGADANWQEESHCTPINTAAWNGELEIVRMLLAHGVHVNLTDEDGNTPLHSATKNSRVEIVRLLLQHGEDISVHANDYSTPLQPSSTLAIARLGANTDAKDKDGRTPLHDAVFDGSIEVVRLLLDHGASANPKDRDGRTPLHEASVLWETKIVGLLLGRGADADAKTTDGSTPLHEASSGGKTEIVRLLLDHGASVDVKDKMGRTPSQVAREYEIEKIFTEQSMLRH